MCSTALYARLFAIQLLEGVAAKMEEAIRRLLIMLRALGIAETPDESDAQRKARDAWLQYLVDAVGMDADAARAWQQEQLGFAAELENVLSSTLQEMVWKREFGLDGDDDGAMRPMGSAPSPADCAAAPTACVDESTSTSSALEYSILGGMNDGPAQQESMSGSMRTVRLAL